MRELDRSSYLTQLFFLSHYAKKIKTLSLLLCVFKTANIFNNGNF